MPPWLAAGMIIASVVAFLFVYNRNEQEQQCHTHAGRSYEPRQHNQNSEREERYDTPPSFRARRHDDQDECPICLEPTAIRAQKTLECGHRLHSNCYSKLRSQESMDSCPICRRKL